MSLIETIKKSEFWSEVYENFNATSHEAQIFLKENNLTTESSHGTATGIKAVVDWIKWDDLSNAHKRIISKVAFLNNDFKEAYLSKEPIIGELYIIDPRMKEEAEEAIRISKEKAEKEWIKRQEQHNEQLIDYLVNTHIKRVQIFNDNSILSKLQKNKNWKQIIKQDIFPLLLQAPANIHNSYTGETYGNPNHTIKGSNGSYYCNAVNSIPENLSELAVDNIVFSTDIDALREYYSIKVQENKGTKTEYNRITF